MTTATRPRDLATVEGSELRLHFHEGQARVWLSEKRFVFMLAGSQGGKTSFGPHWLHREIRQRGPGDYLAVTSSYPLLKLKMLPEFLKLFRDTLHLGEWRAADRVFQFRDEPTRVIFGSAVNPESLESATAKAAWLDEVGQDGFSADAWEAIIRRLSIHRGRVLGTTTLYNLGWLKQQLYDRWQAGADDIEIVQFASTLNPQFPQEEFERAKATMPEWRFRLFYLGEFARPAGLIYSDFVDAYRETGGHKVHPFPLPAEWPRTVGIDFGAVHTALVWLAHDPMANVYYLYRDSLSGGKTTNEHVREARDLAAGTNQAAWYGGARSEEQQRMDWTAAGIAVQQPPIADVEGGIDRVIALWRTRRLYVFDTCTGILDELARYRRKLDANHQPTDEIQDKSTFHRLDSLRYSVAGLSRPAITAILAQGSVRGWSPR